MRAKFTVLGEPNGKGRPRFDPKTGVAHTPKKTASYENLVKTEFRLQCGGVKFPDDAMLDVRVFAYYTIPKSVSKKKRAAMLARQIRPTKKPDFDNIGKVVCDSLNGIAYRDDAQVVDAMVRKFYSEQPRVEVVIQEAAAG